jgi:hypothetical protein
MNGCRRVSSVWVRANPGPQAHVPHVVLRVRVIVCVVVCAAGRMRLPQARTLSASLPATAGGDMEIKFHPGPRSLSLRLHLTGSLRLRGVEA